MTSQEDRFISARLIYDEMGELGSNHSLTLIYDFDEGQSDIYFVDMAILLQAVYAEEALTSESKVPMGLLDPPTKAEIKALELFRKYPGIPITV